MAYNHLMYEKAQKIIDKRRKNAINQQYLRKQEIYKAIPQIYKIDKLISKTSIDVSKEIISSRANSQANLKEILQGLMLKNNSLQEEKKLLLQKNNYPENYLDIEYFCSKCEDTGYVKTGFCECMKKLLKEQVYNKLNMSVNIDNFKFSNFKIDYYPDNYIASEKSLKTPRAIATENLKYCEDFAYNFSRKSGNILMQGGTGLGKTHLSLAIAGVCIEKGTDVVYSSSQQLLHKLESDKFGGAQEGFLDSVLECDLLIIDDWGTEFYTQFTISAFYNIINTRLLENRPTIINTNLSLEEIVTKYSPRIASRIMGEYDILTFYGKDYRAPQ